MARFIEEGTIEKDKRSNSRENTTATNHHRHLLWITEASPRATHPHTALGELNITSTQNISKSIKRENPAQLK